MVRGTIACKCGETCKNHNRRVEGGVVQDSPDYLWFISRADRQFDLWWPLGRCFDEPQLRGQSLVCGGYQEDDRGASGTGSRFRARPTATLGTPGFPAEQPLRTTLERCRQLLSFIIPDGASRRAGRNPSAGVPTNSSRPPVPRRHLCEVH